MLQVCLAYKAEGGRTVAVLSSRPKLEMEAIFASTIPLAKRQGSRFLFRQVRCPAHGLLILICVVACSEPARSAQQAYGVPAASAVGEGACLYHSSSDIVWRLPPCFQPQLRALQTYAASDNFVPCGTGLAPAAGEPREDRRAVGPGDHRRGRQLQVQAPPYNRPRVPLMHAALRPIHAACKLTHQP